MESLKERRVALQGKGAFGAAERPKWEPAQQQAAVSPGEGDPEEERQRRVAIAAR